MDGKTLASAGKTAGLWILLLVVQLGWIYGSVESPVPAVKTCAVPEPILDLKLQHDFEINGASLVQVFMVLEKEIGVFFEFHLPINYPVFIVLEKPVVRDIFSLFRAVYQLDFTYEYKTNTIHVSRLLKGGAGGRATPDPIPMPVIHSTAQQLSQRLDGAPVMDEAGLDEVIKLAQKEAGLQLILSEKIDYTKPVTLSAAQPTLTVGELLDVTLPPRGLGYYVTSSGVLVVDAQEHVDEMLKP